MQLDQQRHATQLTGQQRQLSMQAAAQAGQQRQLTGQQQQLHQAAARQVGPQSWASAAAQPPSLAALADRPANSIAANLAAGPGYHSGSNDSDEWQAAVASHAQAGRRHAATMGARTSGSGGNGGGSSVSSGSPHHTPPDSL